MIKPRSIMLAAGAVACSLAGCNSTNPSVANTASLQTAKSSAQGITWNADNTTTATPIKHLVVLYNENVSFDHYFGTYPNATNPSGEPVFTASAGTPSVNGLTTSLLNNNPNFSNANNGTGASNPFRLDRSQAGTADQNHAYTAEQLAFDNGLMDLFPKYTGFGTNGGTGPFGSSGQVMGYFDGNTVTAMWNYAQHYAMSDNSYADTYGPSTPGALEAVSGQTNGVQLVLSNTAPFNAAPSTSNPYWAYSSYYISDGQGGNTLVNDVDPAYDVCSSTTNTILMTGKNIGDLLNSANITWGGFMAGFDLTATNTNGTTGCKRSTLSNIYNKNVTDYIQHHNWFQYYKSTSNPQHLRPSSVATIGYTYEADGKTLDPANHEYDYHDFMDAVNAGNYPAVSYIKAPAFQDGHAGYSDPLDEQAFATNMINFLMKQPDWKNTAVIIAWDDSDGWYDHAFISPTNASHDPIADQLNGAGQCGKGTAMSGLSGLPVNGRCGPGARLPFMVISPWAKSNYVSHVQISQSSIVRFIEDNWLNGQRLGGGSFDATTGSIMDMFNFSGTANNSAYLLDTSTGEPTTP